MNGIHLETFKLHSVHSVSNVFASGMFSYFEPWDGKVPDTIKHNQYTNTTMQQTTKSSVRTWQMLHIFSLCGCGVLLWIRLVCLRFPQYLLYRNKIRWNDDSTHCFSVNFSCSVFLLSLSLSFSITFLFSLCPSLEGFLRLGNLSAWALVFFALRDLSCWRIDSWRAKKI